MTDVNTALQTTLLKHAVNRTRFENEAVRAVVRVLQRAVRPMVMAVLSSGIHEREGANLFRPDAVLHLDLRRQVMGLMATLTTHWREAVAEATRTFEAKLLQYAELEALELPRKVQRTVDQGLSGTLQEAVGDPEFVDPESLILFNRVPAAQVANLLISPLGGAHHLEAFQGLTDKILGQLRQILLGGLARGEGVPKVAKTIRGLLHNTRWQAERIVRSEYVRVAGQAALMQFHQNRDHLKGVQWVATLDQRTCLQCGKLDGQVWEDATKAPVPVVATHPNCRCIIVPIIKNAKELFLPPGTRAAFNGQVPATVKYNTWFGQQSAAFQRAVLGPTRYQLWKAGKLKLGDFATASGVLPVAKALALARGR